MKHACFIAAALAVALLGFAAPANASHGDGIQCGDTIETSGTVTLQSDIVCPDSFTEFAIQITSSDVWLRLAGHTISAGSPGLGGTAIIGGEQQAPLSRVRVTRGTVAGTDPDRHGFVYGGVSLFASDSYVSGMRITSRGGGIALTGDRNQAHGNVVEITAQGQSSGGIRFVGNDAHATHNTIRGGQSGIAVYADSTPGSTANNPRIAVNTIQDCEVWGIELNAYTDHAVVARNTVTGCNTGIELNPADSAAGGGSVRRNIASGNVFGISVGDEAAYVWCNTANDNASTDGFFGVGIDIAGGEIKANTANNNAAIGINATVGTTDGGGNTATGNGTDCINVTCGPPPDPPCPAAGA